MIVYLTHNIAILCLDAKREWGKPRQSLMGGTPKTALPPQDRAASLCHEVQMDPPLVPLIKGDFELDKRTS